MRNPFRYFNSSPEVIRLVVMMYIRYPLSLRQVEDLLFERGIDICHETIRFWWNRFGPMFAKWGTWTMWCGRANPPDCPLVWRVGKVKLLCLYNHQKYDRGWPMIINDDRTDLSSAGEPGPADSGCLLYTSPSPRDRTRSR